MKKIVSALGIICAVCCIFIICITFMFNDNLARAVGKLDFVKVDPLYTGGEIAEQYASGV